MGALWLSLLLPGCSSEVYSADILHHRSVYLEPEKVPPFPWLSLGFIRQKTPCLPSKIQQRQSLGGSRPC